MLNIYEVHLSADWSRALLIVAAKNVPAALLIVAEDNPFKLEVDEINLIEGASYKGEAGVVSQMSYIE